MYKNMKVRDLAFALGKDVDHVFECLLFIDTNDRNVDNEESQLSLEVAKEVCKKSGVRAMTIAQPSVQKELDGM